MIVERAAASDLPAILALEDSFSVPWSEESWRAEIDGEDRLTLVARDAAGAVVGVSCFQLVAEVAEGRGEIIDRQEQVGGYPAQAEPTRRAFDESQWDLRFMTPLTPEALDRPARRRGT